MYRISWPRKHPEKFGADKQVPNARVGLSWQASQALGGSEVVCRQVGLEFTFDQPMSSSMDALRLLMKASRHALKLEICEVQREQGAAAREAFFEIVSRDESTW